MIICPYNRLHMIDYEDFAKVDMRLGKIIAVELLPNAKYTTHKLTIDFGPAIGTKISCARVINYTKEQLTGKLVIGVVNMPPRQIGRTMSEVLTLGVPDKEKECILLIPDTEGGVIGEKVF